MKRFERKINTRSLPANIMGKRPRSIPAMGWELLNIYAHELMRKRATNDQNKQGRDDQN